MDIAEKIKLLEDSKKRIDALTDELKKREIEKAKAEGIYRQALAKKIIELRNNKVPANCVGDVARGDKGIAILRYNRDVSVIERDQLKIKIKNEYMQIEQIRSLLAYDRANYLNQ